LRELTRRQYQRSLYLTTKILLGYKDVTWFTHGDVFEALEEATTRKLVVLPRGCFKSSICSVAYPIWLLLRDPNERILLDSELYSNSKNLLREIRTHLQRAELTDLFGEFQSDPWNEGEITIAQRTRIYKEASITASGIGAEKTGQHYSVIIADDLNSPSNSHTPEGRRKVIIHYQYNQAILEPNGILAVIGTRYSADDIPGIVIDTELGGLENVLKMGKN
jgi:hypothetical protein